MKILLVSSYLPYPLFSGGHIRLFNLIKHLSKDNEITLVCEKRSYQTEDDIEAIKKYCQEVVTVPRRKQWTLSNIIKTGFSKLPFLIIGHTSLEMQKKIISLLRKKSFDIIHIETSYVYQNLPEVLIPKVLVEHNIEYLVYERFTRNIIAPFKQLLTIDVNKLRKWENEVWKKVDTLVAVSDEEKLVMNRRDVAIIPNGVDLETFNVGVDNQSENKKILFIGDFNWIQNKDSAAWIISEVWPLLKKEYAKKSTGKLTLWIVGRKIPHDIKRLTNDENIIFDENAPSETVKIYQTSDILLAPKRVGGGTSYKIIEAMASGLPVVTTQLGIEGIQVKNFDEVLVGNTTHELSERTVEILTNTDLRKKVRSRARKRMEELYSWETISGKLQQVYQETVKKWEEKNG